MRRAPVATESADEAAPATADGVAEPGERERLGPLGPRPGTDLDHLGPRRATTSPRPAPSASPARRSPPRLSRDGRHARHDGSQPARSRPMSRRRPRPCRPRRRRRPAPPPVARSAVPRPRLLTTASRRRRCPRRRRPRRPVPAAVAVAPIGGDSQTQSDGTEMTIRSCRRLSRPPTLAPAELAGRRGAPVRNRSWETMRSITTEVAALRPVCSAAWNRSLAQAVTQLIDDVHQAAAAAGSNGKASTASARSSAPWMITASSSAPSR